MALDDKARTDASGIRPKTYPNCFGCGAENDAGLALDMRIDGASVRALFTPQPRHEGWPGIVHGGIIAALLYEIMENWPYLNGIAAMMRGMETRLLTPARVGETISVASELERRDGREMTVRGSLSTAARAVAEGSASLVVLTDRQRRRLGIR